MTKSELTCLAIAHKSITLRILTQVYYIRNFIRVYKKLLKYLHFAL
ncbi:hypothetical protein H6G80_22710 [Nostoc sp. FACHB-87]|nr:MULTISPECIES: hypothetical protein [Nostocaceae]MBD2456875.1 hypothetical protein [Nostoc sp. FACHB-87]MBD2478115.1 hypothetical protein [Anabaena sp. FACHB-83]